MKLAALIRSAFVVGRRDFTATVFSKSFLFFLLGPLFPLLIGLLFGGIGANVAEDAERPTVAVIASPVEFGRLQQAHAAMEKGLRGASLARLKRFDAEPDVARQAHRLLASGTPPVTAVLTGVGTDPRLTGAVSRGDPTESQVKLLLSQARAAPPPAVDVVTVARASGSTATARALTAHAGQALLFLLTLLLAGMLLSQLIEEKSNKVIEVLAAAIPVEAIFLGKLFAMLAMSLVGIAVWATAALAGLALFASNGALGALPPPALGWPGFVLLAVVYFASAYLLIGAAFLGIGAQASTVREVQTLSMPITMSQVLVFGLATAAAADMNSSIGLAAAFFPLSSPYAMLARAAQDPAWWPHLLALLWQGLWVAVILRFASTLFRRSVLKSGPQRRRRWWRRAEPVRP